MKTTGNGTTKRIQNNSLSILKKGVLVSVPLFLCFIFFGNNQGGARKRRRLFFLLKNKQAKPSFPAKSVRT
jgi:hypothetical protein